MTTETLNSVEQTKELFNQLPFMRKDRPDFIWLGEESRLFLNRGYLINGTTAEERIRFIADTAEKRLNIPGFADKFFHYMGRGYFSLASPIWSNYGMERGLPISCFGSYIDDSIESIMDTAAEIGVMSKVGGGTSAHFGALRPSSSPIRDNGFSDGPKSFVPIFQSVVDAVAQGTSRRGMMACYLDIEHRDIDRWLTIQQEGDPIQGLFSGVCVGREWLKEMKAGDPEKRKIWAKLLQSRGERGIPYIFFKDNVNEGKPDVYKDKDMTIYASNLCSEIMLPSSIDESFVCCLSSMNLLYYHEWKETDAVQVLTMFLDTVMGEFIDKAANIKHLERAHRFATRHRALGLGVLGWHSFLQSQMIPFESYRAMQLNAEIFKFLRDESLKASQEMASLYGEPEILEGYGRRNTTLLSVAPTKSSSAILGMVSASVEPFKSNHFIRDLAKLKTIYRNPFLEALLESRGENTSELWEGILIHDGSIQSLDNFSDEEKAVFRTFSEIEQDVVIRQAAQRQQFIDQGQSINLMIPSHSYTTKEINQLILLAEELGIKSLYYQFNVNAAQAFNRSAQLALANEKAGRKPNEEYCASCEG